MRKGQTMTDEQRLKISTALKGRKLTERHKARVRRGVIRYWATTATDEHRRAMGLNGAKRWR